MNRKQVTSIIIPLTILLLAIGGLAVFRQWRQENLQPYAFSGSASWSQNEDFVLGANKEGFIVRNTRIPFFFQLLPDWQAQITRTETQEWAIDIRHPETTFTADGLIQSGCWLSLETVQSGEYNQFLKEEIQEITLSENLSFLSLDTYSSYQIERRILTTPDNYQALEEITSTDQIQLITVGIPLEKGQVIKIEGQFCLPDIQDCQQGLGAILQTIKISKDQ